MGDPHMNSLRPAVASPTASEKGKGRAKDLVESSKGLDSSFEMDDDTETTADYETALESALFDQRSPSTNRYHESNGGASNEAEEEDAEFVYDGKDDEDMRIFREEAKLESLDYKERLRGILGDAAEVDEPVDCDGLAVSRSVSMDDN